MSYENEYKIENLYQNCEKRLKNEIDTKRKAALEKAGGNRFNMDFDIQRDIYDGITNK